MFMVWAVNMNFTPEVYYQIITILWKMEQIFIEIKEVLLFLNYI